jgi:hypothetical protein
MGLRAHRGGDRKLGITVSATSVRRILRRHGLCPAPRRHCGPTWVEFGKSAVSQQAAEENDSGSGDEIGVLEHAGAEPPTQHRGAQA